MYYPVEWDTALRKVHHRNTEFLFATRRASES